MAWNAGFGIELSILIKCARMPTVVILVGSDFLLLPLLLPIPHLLAPGRHQCFCVISTGHGLHLSERHPACVS